MTANARKSIAGRRTFLRSFLAHPRQVGAVFPTSRRAVRDMLDLAGLQRARLVVELGAGTGVHTRELLRRLGPDARLLAFEIDQTLSAALSATIDDSRLRLLNASAEEVGHHLEGADVDVIVSALPFTSLPAAVRRRVLDSCQAILAPAGAMLVLQYSPLIKHELEQRFDSVERRLSPLNLPPAFLFRCTAPVAPA